MERQQDHRGARIPACHGYRVRSNWWKRACGGVEPQAARQPPVPAIFDGEKQAKLIALACSKPPEGHAALDAAAAGGQGRGTGDRHCEHSTIGRALKKQSEAARRQYWVIPPKATAPSSQRWRTCSRSTPTARSRPAARVPRRDVEAARRRDARAVADAARPAGALRLEYKRNGTANLFMLFARSRAGATSSSPSGEPPSTRHVLRDLSDIHFAGPPRSCWSRTTSTRTRPHRSTRLRAHPGAPLVERFEWHYTPKHGSWLNLAESELAVLAQPSTIARRAAIVSGAKCVPGRLRHQSPALRVCRV